MARLTAEEIANVALAAGVPRDQLATAVAIALAESGGNPQAHNGVPPDDSYGLWQINMIGAMGPARRREFGLASNSELFTPAVNARAMVKISGGGTNWRPWTTFTRGTYLIHLTTARNAASKATGSVTTTPVIGPGDTFSGLLKASQTLTSVDTWKRVGLFLGGFILLVIALAKLTGDNRLSPMTKTIVKTVVTRKVSR